MLYVCVWGSSPHLGKGRIISADDWIEKKNWTEEREKTKGEKEKESQGLVWAIGLKIVTCQYFFQSLGTLGKNYVRRWSGSVNEISSKKWVKGLKMS